MARLLTKKQVIGLVGFSNAEIYRREKACTFPARLKLGAERNSKALWVESEVLEWIDAFIASQRDHLHDTAS